MYFDKHTFDNKFWRDSNCLMAREDVTAEEFAALAKKVSTISSGMDEIVRHMKDSGVPNVRVHLAMLTKRLLPQIEHWLDVAQLHVRDDVRSYLLGVESPSAAQKRYNENRKRAAARKSTPKPSKKTATKKS